MTDLLKRLQGAMRGEVTGDQAERERMSRDTSVFKRVPEAVAFPEDADDLAALVKEAHAMKTEGVAVSITARAAGTDMSGGPLTTSVVASMKRLDSVGAVTVEGDHGYASTEPGVFYRDFEKKTLEKGLLLPSYPASREIAAMGGIIANNSGGERTLKYGKTEDYVEELECVLSDGSRALFKALSPSELQMKMVKQDLEGDIYRRMHELLSRHKNLIESHRPAVSKNSAGYALWSVRQGDTFNLAKLICGSQGTLALWTKARLKLVKPAEHRAMLVIFLSDLNILPEVVGRILPHAPESFESYDDHTFTLAVKFLPEMLSQMGFAKAARLGMDFLPEAAMVATGGVPKMILMAEFAEATIEEADVKAAAAAKSLEGLDVQTKVEKNEKESEKYWIVRRESFSLLRKNLHGKYASPFIDDVVVPPESYPKFLPELNALLESYKDRMIYTVAGHIGNGNFHIIPLMDLADPEARKVILELSPKVYDLVMKYGGTTTGEHNDGIIRTPYLPQLFGAEMVKLFEETKKIFDPLNVLNPGKKVAGTFADIERDMLTASS